MDRRPVLIAGPTASGKSSLALALAEAWDGVVINADAVQVYAGWRVLTARPSPEDEARAPHRLYGCVAVDRATSAGRWLRACARVLREAEGAGRVPIVVGGSGLLFAALTEGLAEIPETPPEIRAAADALLAEIGGPALADRLRARDPESWAALDRANPRRVARAWEVLETTGRGLAAWRRETPAPLLPPDAARRVRLMPDRARLRAAIAARFDAMLAGGAREEAAAARRWRDPAPTALQALGAAQLMAADAGEMSWEAARDRAVDATRRYAKRQLSWARNRMADWPAAESAEDARVALLGR